MRTKVCPLLSVVVCEDVECKEDQCAWWNEGTESCMIAAAVGWLRDMADQPYRVDR